MSAKRAVHDFGQAASVVLPAGLTVAAFAAAMLATGGARLGALAILGLICGGAVIAASGYALVLRTLEKTSSKIALTWSVLVAAIAL